MRKICFITGTRAEYGLLRQMMYLVLNDTRCELQIIATNMHLMPEFGNTYLEIEKDGFKIDEKVPMPKPSDDAKGIISSMAKGMSGITESLSRLQPDITVILGDRYEALAAALACHFLRIPVAHIHGGEITIGAMDDAMRHCITKLSSLHFTATEEYRHRVIQLGEHPDRVFNTGAPGVDNIKNIPRISQKELEDFLDMDLSKDTVMVTYHPATLSKEASIDEINQVLEALDAFPTLQIIFTMPNSDEGGDAIREQIIEYCKTNPERTKWYASLGSQRYLSLLPLLKAVVGNSSSGIIEAPSAHIPTVDIGDRQKGRTRGDSVISCKCDKMAIIDAITLALSLEMQNKAMNAVNPYEGDDTSKRIVETIATYNLESLSLKIFYDNL